MRTPRTSFPIRRIDCRSTPRPCPYVSCSHNTYLTVTAARVIVARPGLEPDEVPEDESCSLDVAASGPQTLERIGRILGITRERVRQIETKILAKILEAVDDRNRSNR